MGKRKKASKPQGPKKRDSLATTFQCLFCNHENAVTVKFDRKVGIGTLNCKVCGQSFQSSIHNLSEAIDVYSEWIDACDAVAKEEGVGGGYGPSSPYRGTSSMARAQRVGRTAGDEEEDDNDGFIVDDEGDMEANFRDAE